MSIGGALFVGNSKLFTGPLGVVKIGFKGFDCGKTTADSTLVPDQDVKGINYQQDGTKPADYVRTGMEYLLKVTFGKINTGFLKLMMAGIDSDNVDTADDYGSIGRELYQSMLDNEAGGLKVGAVDSDGIESDELEDNFAFYTAIPVVNGDLVNWGADTQRAFAMEFKIKWHKFLAGESATKSGGFGYWGDPTSVDMPAIVYPDLLAPVILTADASAAITLLITFDENIAYQTVDDPLHYVTKVDGEYILPVSGSILTTVLTLTFPAATFSAAADIEISISELALEDTESTANAYAGVDAHPCTDSI